MWLYTIKLAASVILLAVHVLTLKDIDVAIEKGSDFIIAVETKEHDIYHCYLTFPNGNIVGFNPEEGETKSDKYDFNISADKKCSVLIKDLDENDSGVWVLKYEYGDDQIDKQVYSVTVKTGMVTKSDTDNRILQQVDHVTRVGAFFDISLSKIDDQEECFLTTPEGQRVPLTSNHILGVEVRNSSNYVNCRVTIGPMEQKLLGIWSLCGRRSDNIERCQPANVTWYSNTDPSMEWEFYERPKFDYVVNFGEIISPSVSGYGDLLTCQIVTPTGEDIALTADTNYPGLQRTALDLISVCRVDIGPIDATMLGDWVIYAKVHSPFFGFSETRMPFSFYLYDKDNPYAQAHNVTTLDPVNRLVHIGNTITTEVTGTGSVMSCHCVTPAGLTYSSLDSISDQKVIFEDVGTRVACRVIIETITETMLGRWKIIGKFNHRDMFNEIRQPINIIKEDPENPIEDGDRRVDILTPQTLNSELGARHTIAIPLYSFTTVESCHLRTPQGLQYKIMEGFKLPGITIENNSDAACVISITIDNENMVGEWTLISRAIIISQSVEQRLSFTVYVEEIVEAFPSEVTIIEGNDLYVRLREPIVLANTCRLIGPNENIMHDVDTIHKSACGFIVRDINQSGSGQWEIVFGTGIVYKAHINVTVVENQDIDIGDVILYKHSTANETLGPENLIYCRLQDPKGFTVFESFGRCRLVIDRVSAEHEGKWVMAIGIPGHIVVEKYNFLVIVIDEDDKPVVITHVEKQRPEVILSCKLSSTEAVRTCKFRDPNGEILIASQGVGQYRYAIGGTEVGLESELSDNECGLRITNPTNNDLGLWRCAMDTESKTYFGFLSVLCPWVLQETDKEDVIITEPILTADRASIYAIEGDSVTMSCFVQAPIRYCYFRRQNGTTFSVGQATSTAAMEYVGAGFEAGECGVRFRNMVADDSGSWSCHVGLKSDTEPEQRAQFDVVVEPPMTVRLDYNFKDELIAEANISMPGTLEYCRFLRMDGVGFASTRVPEGYTFIGSLPDKYCAIKMDVPTILNLHPWVIAAKLVGMDTEILRTTTEELLVVVPDDQAEDPDHIHMIFHWVIISLLIMLTLLLLLAIVPKIDKKWVNERMTSFRKKPVDHSTA
ncbi:hypothetical protein K1T71_012125 [Dendrolimus kikuchii]|uniref:Uncharacterized protein n=1 Tax=Dendrolimus kikuchii TaxID=765133 RepID=A0ACC1CKY9_9NEOP|nr:hypothetical protein K1T71_012125 [Dendrolimus kikuchii]